MKQSTRFRALLCAITDKDWTEYRKAITFVTLSMLIPVLMTLLGTQRPEFARGIAGGGLMAGAFIYAQSCFYNERERGTLELLLNLPVKPFELIIAKFLSMYSMMLFTINVPGLILRDWHLLLITNGSALFLSSLFMMSTVISDKPWAPQIPLMGLIALMFPVATLVRRFVPNGIVFLQLLSTHTLLLASLGIVSAPVFALTSALIFNRAQK